MPRPLLAPLPRTPGGRIRWRSPEVAVRLTTYLRLGWTHQRIARHLGSHAGLVNKALEHHGLRDAPAGYVFVRDLAPVLHMAPESVRNAAKRRGLPLARWGGQRMLRDRDAERLLADCKPGDFVVREAPEGYLSSRDLTAIWHLGHAQVRRRLARHGVTPVMYLRGAGGDTPLYDPASVAPAAPPIRAPRRPAGTVKAEHLAELCGKGHSTVLLWVQQGCPHIPGKTCRWFRPEAVQAWLAARPDPRQRATAERLRAALTPEARRAA